MNVTEAYRQVVDLMAAEKLDLKEIAIQVAKTNPKVFLKAVEDCRMNLPRWQITACRLFEERGKLAAVKHVKDERGMSLMDAKLEVEKLEERFRLKRPH